jgi:uncharacterized SAM-binding protein YcdF (DUF218 family)
MTPGVLEGAMPGLRILASIAPVVLSAMIGLGLWPANEAPAQIAQVASPDTLTGVIALGGGDHRIREAGRLARQFPHLRVVVTGTDPKIARSLLGPLIGPERIQIEPTARNTREEAVNAAELIAPRPGERWLLVTSQSHMPRALCAFAKAGFPVEPWPLRDGESRQQRETELAKLDTYKLLGWCDPGS